MAVVKLRKSPTLPITLCLILLKNEIREKITKILNNKRIGGSQKAEYV